MKTIAKTTTRSTFWAVALFYILIAFEFFYMASPFAAYFYGVYKPCLSFIDKFPSVSWITGFFLPHLAEDTKSPLINSVKTAGVIIASTGLITFLVCAFQVYYAKLFKKGMVHGGLYKYIRHPQYTAFAVCSFGLLLLWPRYLVLIMFVTLLFAYYLLAKAEEKECEHKFGSDYLRYKDRTFMFLPVKFNLKYSKTSKILLMTVLYLLAIVIALQTGKGVKRASIASLYTKYNGNAVYMSVFEMPASQMNNIINVLNKNTGIQATLSKYDSENKKLINYILPVDMYISEIPMIKPQHATCHVYKTAYRMPYKIVYTWAKFSNKTKPGDGNGILFHAIGLNPIMEVRFDVDTNKVLQIKELPATAIRYENTPEPIF